MIDVNFTKVFSKSYWDMYGFSDIRNIRLGIAQSDRDYSVKSDSKIIEIAVADGNLSTDTSGIVAYDEGGVRVIYKGIAGGDYDFDNDLYMMLLVENNSGQKIYIDDDNFSINGFMADALSFSLEIENGEKAARKIEIYERSLKECDVRTASDIEEIEFTIEIRDENWRNKKEGDIAIKIG